MKKNLLLFVVISVVLATLSRLLPHPFNFTPLIGITLFSAAYLPKRWMGWVLPMGCWLFSDILVNVFIQSKFVSGWSYFYSYTAIGVYVSLLLVFALGNILRNNVKISSLLGVVLGSSLLFYWVTNSFVFFGAPSFYPQNFAGYIQCLVAGIPFIRTEGSAVFGSFFFNGIMGDLVYSGILFGSYYLVNKKSLKPAYV